LFRDQNIRRQIDKRRIPAQKEPLATLEAECEQALLRREAVIVERVDTVRHVDVVAGEPIDRFDPSGMEAEIGVSFERCVGELPGRLRWRRIDDPADAIAEPDRS
jgi:hypothetical protein